MQSTTETSQCDCVRHVVHFIFCVCSKGLCVHVCDIGGTCYDVC